MTPPQETWALHNHQLIALGPLSIVTAYQSLLQTWQTFPPLCWVSNLTITTTDKLIGGVVTGYIKNQGTMLDFEFKGMSIIGGTLGGVIRNTSQVGGYFQDVTLQANTKITGGTLKGTLNSDKKSPALLEKVQVKKGSHLSGVKLGKGVKLEKGVVVEDQVAE